MMWREEVMQDWITVRGEGTGEVVQSRDGYVDTEGFDLAAMVVQIPYMNNCNLMFDTSPELNVGFMEMLQITSQPQAQDQYTYRFYLGKDPDLRPSRRVMRYLRWRVVATGTNAKICFRVVVIPKSIHDTGSTRRRPSSGSVYGASVRSTSGAAPYVPFDRPTSLEVSVPGGRTVLGPPSKLSQPSGDRISLAEIAESLRGQIARFGEVYKEYECGEALTKVLEGLWSGDIEVAKEGLLRLNQARKMGCDWTQVLRPCCYLATIFAYNKFPPSTPKTEPDYSVANWALQMFKKIYCQD